MSANGTRTIIWDGGEHEFCLAKIGHLLDLEQKCGAGLSTIMRRLSTGDWYLNDVREPIRLGLIGGGMAADNAMNLVKNHVDDRPLASSVILALEVIAAVIVGVPDDQVGSKKKTQAEDGASSTTTEGSADQSLSA